MAGLRNLHRAVVVAACIVACPLFVYSQDHMLVANRGSGSFSRIDIATNTVTNFALPDGGEPMKHWAVATRPRGIVD